MTQRCASVSLWACVRTRVRACAAVDGEHERFIEEEMETEGAPCAVG